MLRKSLATKLIFYIGIVLVVTIGFFAYINTKTQKKLLIEERKLTGIQLGQMIEKSISFDMLTSQNDRIQKTLEDVGNSEVIEIIRIFDKNGKIFGSSTREEIGSSVDITAAACVSCHTNEKPSEKLPQADMTRIFKTDRDYRLLGIINPIYNEPKCSNAACHFHPEQQSILGVMDIQLPLDLFDRQMGVGQRQTVLCFLFIFLIIALGIGLLIYLFVNRPINNLIVATRKITAGDLKYRIGNHHSDEIGVLSASFDSMTAELQKSGKEVARWNIKLENEVKKSTENLEKANKKLKELVGLKSNWMRKMEHGLRSHIGIIQSCLSLAFKEGQSGLSAQQNDLISTAKRRSVILLEMLDDIVQLSYLQSASAEYLVEPVPITFILHKVLEDFRVQAQKKNISVDIQVPADSPIIQADLEALEEAFSNLVNNAIKYTKRNGTIFLSAKEKENVVTIDIIDSGIGIAADDLPKIFNAFFRASNAKSNRIEGTGVGLAIVNEIIAAHHGEIKVWSELGKGTTITVILPKSAKLVS
ncbi:ATP-binding protein [Acidobacteriota bacterium]